MNKLIISIVVAITAIFAASQPLRAAEKEFFTRPVPPDTMMALQPRCDFIVTRFWDRCNFEQAFLHPEKLNAAFGEWVMIMPHASADSAHVAIEKLLQKVEKSGPFTLGIAEMAENWLYSNTAELRSEEVYLPFARAAANHKKISKAEKARYRQHAQIIESSGVGATVPDLPFTRPDGSKGSLADAKSGSVLIFINDPECDECAMARVHLSADYNTKELIKQGQLTVVSIYPGEPSDEAWKEVAASCPDTWVVGAMPDADLYFDLRETPAFLFLNAAHKVLAKDMPVEHFLNAFRVVNTMNQ